MKNFDLKYLCTTIGNLSGIPIRLYENENLILFHSTMNLPIDPMNQYFQDIMNIKNHVGYFITKSFYYYGIVNSDNIKIIIGPTRQFTAEDKELKELAFRLDVPQDDMDDFINGMKSIIPMPLESVIQTLCAMNHITNGEQLSIKDICLYDTSKDQFEKMKLMSGQLDSVENSKNQEKHSKHNSLYVEENIAYIVRSGDLAALDELVKSSPTLRSGKVAKDSLRQSKNIFIVTATLVSRAAIRGGLDAEEALSLSDNYIQHCELLDDVVAITSLQYVMIRDYTEKVQRIRLGKSPSKLVTDVANYVQHHISEPISTEDMAKDLFLSRSRLSTKFKEQSGETLTDFILKEKVAESKRLLRYSEKTVPAISLYLGFSSQSHFSRVFKKYTGITPKEYQDKHKL
ncbi:MAG: helix-turn-helix domain-containing protein [Clostridia bacterium]|nr:helix-turn-helix domain-containing protein [Clostridia bacterium]